MQYSRRWLGGACLASTVPAVLAVAQTLDSTYRRQDTVQTLTVGAFVDTYDAWDCDRPHTFDRAETTPPARHAEFNVDLAFIDATRSSCHRSR
jgi:hypothetical protein